MQMTIKWAHLFLHRLIFKLQSTLLFGAAEGNNLEMIRYLIEQRRMDINVKDKKVHLETFTIDRPLSIELVYMAGL